MDDADRAGMRGLVLRTPRLLLVVTGVLLVFLVILYGATRLITDRSFTTLETEGVREEIRRAEATLDHVSDRLIRTTNDYAQWDDAYDFAKGTSPAYLTENAVPAVMQNLSLDFMAVISPGHSPNEGRLLNSDGTVVVVPESVLAVLDSPVLSGAYDPLSLSGSGLVVTPAGLFLVATSPITNTGGAKKSGSFLAMGRVLDERVAGEIEDLTRVPARLESAATVANLSDDARSAIGESPGAVGVVALDERSIQGSTLLESLDGQPAALLSITMPRTARSVGGHALDLLRWALLCFGIAACASVAYVIVLQNREVLQRKRAEESARASEQRYRTLIEHMADAVLGLSSDGIIVLSNPAAVRLTGRAETELVGIPVSDLMTSEAWERTSRRLELESLTGATDSFEIDIIHSSSRVIPVEVSASPTLSDDGMISGVQWIARDVTDRRRFEQELVFLANQDYLTGLFNRRRFEEELIRQIGHAARTGRCGALLWMDVDFFKDINDSLGHQAGDHVLVGITGTTRRNLRADSILARLGGDEFAILLPETDRQQAEECAARLVAAIQETPYLFEGRELRTTVSMGIVIFPDHGSTLEELLARADLAMYRAKDGGRNRFCVYETSENWHAEQRIRFDWVSLIDRAIREDRFIVYAQPVVSLANGRIDRHELLIRMEGEDGSILLPATFLPVAERTGLIHQVDRWMVRRAIDLISMSAGKDASYRLDINLSGRAFSDPELLRLIESELIRTDIDPSSFGVEVTETAAVSDMGKAREFITALRNMGCRVSLDDFGSGFSSFYYLKNLPVDCLKIDGSFVQNICTNLQDQHVVRAMVELSEGFGIASVAEYVEDAETLELLKSFGVTFGQGHHISRPVPVSELERLLEDNRREKGRD